MELESSRILLASVWTMSLERAEDLLGKWKVFVCDQIKILVKRKDCWTLGFTTKEQKICIYSHVHTKQEKH